MNRKYLSFIALAVTILFGVGFAILDPVPTAYTVGGGAVIAILWIAVGVFGKDETSPPDTATPDSPYGTPPQDR